MIRQEAGSGASLPWWLCGSKRYPESNSRSKLAIGQSLAKFSRLAAFVAAFVNMSKNVNPHQ